MGKNRISCLVLTLVLTGPAALAQGNAGSATRSDSIDILHTRIALDLTDADNGIISGDATIAFAPRVAGITLLPLDLLLPVDSVVMNGTHLPFTQTGEDLMVDLQGAHGPADTLTLTVSYHGDPVTDSSGFGGFYTLFNYQYDLGVAFDALPHSYGRAWFPCFDNFVERSSFEYFVHTSGDRSVYANGALIGTTDLGGGEKITNWRIDQPIPSYLASVTAGNYAALLDTFPSVSGGAIPVVLAALPNDTAQMRSSFAHLKNAFDTFENWFGPYRWNRVGYVLTSAGAMEHATNICYPDFAADGTLTNEDLIAHELSHHWFGDLITCARPEEMYINEGFADFCAKLFLEGLYGHAAYMAVVRSNHHQVVAKSHMVDGGWYALADVPQDVTYGETSYKKGSDIARTLRSVMGDSLFSAGFKHVFAANAYTAMGSAALRDSLGAATGMDLTGFFNDWIFQPGGAAFAVDSFSVTPNGGQFDVQTYVRQKTRGGGNLFQQVPVTLTCLSAAGEIHRTVVGLGGDYSSPVITCPFLPEAVRLNDDERLALSTTLDTATIVSTGQKNFSDADIVVVTSALPAPASLRIEEYWVAADGGTPGNGAYSISPDRWWRVEGELPTGTQMALRFTVDGRAGYISAYDQGLTQDVGGAVFREDSLVVLYRPDAHFPWEVKPSSINNIGSHTDKNARLDMPDLAPGDYAIAWRTLPTAIHEAGQQDQGWRYFPDPATDHVTVVAPLGTLDAGTTLVICDLHGRNVATQSIRSTEIRVDLSRLSAQVLMLSVHTANGKGIPLGQLHLVH